MKVSAVAVTADTAARRVLVDRGAQVVNVGFYLAVIAVLGSLWRTAVDANGGLLVGYSAAALTWYIAASEAATVALNVRLIEEVGDDIASGSIVVELLRPASVLGVRVVTAVGRALPRLGLLVVAGTLFSWLAVGAPPRPAAALLAVPSLVLAITCNLVAQHAVAGVAFWIRDAKSAWFLYQKFVFVVGGMLLPLEVLPEGLQSVAMVLPFMAMAYAPARLVSGHLEPGLLLVQCAWLLVLGAIAYAVFATGERRLQAVGG